MIIVNDKLRHSKPWLKFRSMQPALASFMILQPQTKWRLELFLRASAHRTDFQSKSHQNEPSNPIARGKRAR